MQWCTAFFVFFCTCHFRTVQTARDTYFDSFSSCADGRLDGHFDGAAIVDACFQLLGNGFCNDIGVQFWLTDLRNVDLNVFARQFFQLFANAINLLATFTDNNTGAGIGLRYDTGLGPIRFDVAAPISGTTGDGVQFYVGLGQSF